MIAPVIEGKDAPKPGDKAEAWIRPGTGTARVTRSFIGFLTGANGPNHYFTAAAAAARVDRHERLHISSTKLIHDANIVPLERRIAKHRPLGTLPMPVIDNGRRFCIRFLIFGENKCRLELEMPRPLYWGELSTYEFFLIRITILVCFDKSLFQFFCYQVFITS